MNTKLYITGLVLCMASLTMRAQVLENLVPMTDDQGLKLELKFSEAPVDGVSVNIDIRHHQSHKQLFNGNYCLGASSAADTVMTLEIRNLKPELWFPTSPELYDLTVDAGPDGKCSRRIGFRRFEIRDGGFYLNGHPFYLRGNAINPPGRGIPEELEGSRAFAQDYVRYLKSLNINIIRIPENQNWLDVCDEEGMMVFSGRYGRPKHATREHSPQDFGQSLETYKTVELSPLAAHPSVVIYVLANEMPYEGELADEYRSFLARLSEALHQWDPTRAYIGNAGYGRGKSSDIYDVHRYWGWYYNSYLTYLNMRRTAMWQNEGRIQPVTFTECVGNYTGIDGRFNLCSRTKQPVAQKCWTGHLPDSLQAGAALEYQAFVLKNATEMFRRLRCINPYLSGTMPFTIMFYHWDGISSFEEMDPKPAALQYRTSYQPVLLSWENWQYQKYAGDTFSVIAHVVNDDEHFRALEQASLVWKLEKEGQNCLSGKTAFPNVPYYGTDAQKLEIALPEGLETGDYRLVGELYRGQELVSRNETEVFIAGEDWEEPPSDTRIAVYETVEGTPVLTWLKEKGWKVRRIRTLQQLSPKMPLLIAKDSWDEGMDTTSLARYIRRGGRMLLMEQERLQPDLSWLPAKVKFLDQSCNDTVYLTPTISYRDGMNINRERPEHPVFRNLGWRRLRLWSDSRGFDETQEGFPNVYPVRFGYDINASGLENVAILADYSRALHATALSEIFMGKGSLLLSGFDLADHLGADPAAGKLFRNMLDYICGKAPHERFVPVSGPIVWGDYETERGVANANQNGLIVNTVPIIPSYRKDQEGYHLKVDRNGFQYAGAYGGWNSKPGVQYVARGRRAFGPFRYSLGGSQVAADTEYGEGFFYLSMKGSACKTMVTELENPSDEEVMMSIRANDNVPQTLHLQPHSTIRVKTDISSVGEVLKVSFKGDRRVVILKTEFE